MTTRTEYQAALQQMRDHGRDEDFAAVDAIVFSDCEDCGKPLDKHAYGATAGVYTVWCPEYLTRIDEAAHHH